MLWKPQKPPGAFSSYCSICLLVTVGRCGFWRDRSTIDAIETIVGLAPEASAAAKYALVLRGGDTGCQDYL